MRMAMIFAVFLLAAIFMAALYGNNIKTYVVAEGIQTPCVYNGIMCSCYSQECVCGDFVISKELCEQSSPLKF